MGHVISKSSPSKKEIGIDATPERITIFANHPAWSLLQQMYATERRLFKSDMENVELRAALDKVAASNRKLKAKRRK